MADETDAGAFAELFARLIDGKHPAQAVGVRASALWP